MPVSGGWLAFAALVFAAGIGLGSWRAAARVRVGLGVVLIAVVGFGCAPIVRHDARLKALRERVAALPTPPDTTVAAHDGGDDAFGNFGPASNYCTYRVRMTYVTELREAEVRAFYQSMSVPGVERQDRASLSVFWEGGQPATYIVEAWQITGAGLDLRCH